MHQDIFSWLWTEVHRAGLSSIDKNQALRSTTVM